MRFPTFVLGDCVRRNVRVVCIGDRGLRQAGWFLLGFMTSIGSFVISDLALAQVSTTITNTATGSFRPTANDPIVPVTSKAGRGTTKSVAGT